MAFFKSVGFLQQKPHRLGGLGAVFPLGFANIQ
jgi:hypothetical protein